MPASSQDHPTSLLLQILAACSLSHLYKAVRPELLIAVGCVKFLFYVEI